MKVSELIKDKRREKKLTLLEIAKEMGVTRQLVWQWENGKSFPCHETLVKLDSFLGLNIFNDSFLAQQKESVKA